MDFKQETIESLEAEISRLHMHYYDVIAVQCEEIARLRDEMAGTPLGNNMYCLSPAEDIAAREGAVAHKATVLDRHWFAMVGKEDALRHSKSVVNRLREKVSIAENELKEARAGWIVRLGRWAIRMLAGGRQ